jgi:hypothetical protein
MTPLIVWYFVLTLASSVSVTIGHFPTQAACEQYKQELVARSQFPQPYAGLSPCLLTP